MNACYSYAVQIHRFYFIFLFTLNSRFYLGVCTIFYWLGLEVIIDSVKLHFKMIDWCGKSISSQYWLVIDSVCLSTTHNPASRTTRLESPHLFDSIQRAGLPQHLLLKPCLLHVSSIGQVNGSWNTLSAAIVAARSRRLKYEQPTYHALWRSSNAYVTQETMHGRFVSHPFRAIPSWRT